MKRQASSGDDTKRQIQAEAAAWMARLHADDRDEADARGFRDWLAADPAHAMAFEAIDNVWSLTGALPRGLRGELTPAARAPHRLSRRALTAGVGALAVAGAGVALLRPASARVYQTDTGEQKHVMLSDGSGIFLDAQTRLSVCFSDKERSANLQYGRVNFRIARDARRPFVVEAADRRIIATQSSFDVRCEGDHVQVVLIRGGAAIRAVDKPAEEKTLQPGERLVARTGAMRLDKPNLTPLLAWQTGQAIFENEELSAAVQEMNRYSTEKLDIADPRLSAMRVSGVYRVGDNAAFARSVAQLLPIAVHREADQVLLLGDDSRL